MRNSSWRAAFATTLLAAAIPAALTGEPPKPPADAIPFMCFTQTWDGPFKVGACKYDSSRKQLVWPLRARKDGRLAAYEAFIGDGDGVELSTLEVAITPADKQFKAGARLQAVVTLKDIDVNDIAQLTVRLRPVE